MHVERLQRAVKQEGDRYRCAEYVLPQQNQIHAEVQRFSSSNYHDMRFRSPAQPNIADLKDVKWGGESAASSPQSGGGALIS